jgi:hypothetical protein
MLFVPKSKPSILAIFSKFNYTTHNIFDKIIKYIWKYKINVYICAGYKSKILHLITIRLYAEGCKILYSRLGGSFLFKSKFYKI